MSNTLSELARFQTDRELEKKPFDGQICVMNIVEEMLEMYGIQDNTDRTLAKGLFESFLKTVKDSQIGLNDDIGVVYSVPTTEDMIDALCDIQVFAGGDVMKIGYDNDKCIAEVAKEINSREGEIVNGKFQKYKTEEAMSKWYKADFSGCKLDG